MGLLEYLWGNTIVRWAIVISAILFLISLVLMLLGFIFGFALLGAMMLS